MRKHKKKIRYITGVQIFIHTLNNTKASVIYHKVTRYFCDIIFFENISK